MFRLSPFAAALSLAILLPVVSPALADTAQAATPSISAPATADDCLKLAFDLAQAADDQKLPESKLDSLEALLTKMETQCDARQFSDAMASAEGIRKLIATP